MSKEVVIQVDSLVKKYGDLAAVKNVQFQKGYPSSYSISAPKSTPS